MKNKISLLLTIIFLFSINLFSQTSKQMGKEEFNFLMDSLSTEKSMLLLQKEKLNTEIDSLKNKLAELEEKWSSGRVSQLRKKYGKSIAKRVASGQIWKGMSDKMLEDSWGKPDKITTNKERWGVFTQWYYGDITYFFKDGIMTDWEEKK